MTQSKHVRLSALSCEILTREYDYLGDPGAFGRLAQEIIVAAIKRVHPEAHDNRGAGTPDCKYLAGDTAWAWEIKHDPDGKINLSTRDIEGMMADRNSPDHRPRLFILDMRFPVSVWCINSGGIEPGDFNVDSNTHLQQYEESMELSVHINEIVRACDEDLIASEEEAKRIVREVTENL